MNAELSSDTYDNLLSETRKEIEKLSEVDVEYQSCLLAALDEKERLRGNKSQRVHSCAGSESGNNHPSKAEIDPRYKLYIEHLKKQEEIRALGNVREDLPKDIDPEDELNLKKDEIHNLEDGKEELHGTTERRKRNRRDFRYGLYLEDLKKRHALKDQKEGVPASKENEVSDEPVNPSHTNELLHVIENHRKRDQKSISSKRVDNKSSMERMNKDKGKRAERGKCSTDSVTRNLELGVNNMSMPGRRVLRRRRRGGGGDGKLECKKGRRVVSSNKEQCEDGNGAPKMHLRSVKRECVSRKTYSKANSKSKAIEGGDEDGCDDEDVKILDKTAFNKMIEVIPSPMACEGTPMELSYRQQVIALLQKPYDKEEHKELHAAVTQHKAKQVFRDFCHGRERYCRTDEEGKSYLDHYPGLHKKLELHKANIPRCLNILRGFFFWLQNSTQNRSFRPWRDLECLKTYPVSN